MNALIQIQQALKAPKNKRNDFGKYFYRSCEDILEALKPLLHAHNAQMTIADEIVLIGAATFVKSTVTLKAEGETEVTTAYAKHAEDRKGMDDAQITGSASSYARKYALNGMFLIDDAQDPDAAVQQPPPLSTPAPTAVPVSGTKLPPPPPLKK